MSTHRDYPRPVMQRQPNGVWRVVTPVAAPEAPMPADASRHASAPTRPTDPDHPAAG